MPGATHSRSPGVMESLQQIFRGCIEYLFVRLEIAGLESKGAFRQILKVVIAVAVAILGLLAGFIYLSLSLIYVLAIKVGWGWGYALLSGGVIMLGITAIGLLLARKHLQGAWFPTTLSELKKDTEWLKQNSNPNA